MLAPTLQQLRRFAQANEALVTLLLALGGVIGLALRWRAKIAPLWKKILEPRPREGVPRETMRAVLNQAGRAPWWGPASQGETRGMQVMAYWTFTNIVRQPVKLVGAYLALRPPVHGHVVVRHPEQEIYGEYYLQPGRAVPGSTDFVIFPAIRRPDQDLRATVVLIDNLNNKHRVRNVVFKPLRDGA